MCAYRISFSAMLIAAVALPAVATDYFVASTVGSDSFNGRNNVVAGATGPFASFKPFQSIVLRHGDRILLRCGERFTGPLSLTLNSLDAGELTLGRYGDCTASNRPVIDGRVPLGTQPTDELQQFSETITVEQVFAGDRPLPRARYPEDRYLILPDSAIASTATLAPYVSLIGRPLNGARLHARTEEWFIEEREVVGANGQLDAVLQYPLRPKGGFYLTGKSWMIGERTAWAYDAHERKLFVRAPPGATLSKVAAGHLLKVTGRGSLAVVGVDFDAAGGDAIYCHLDGTVSIKDVSVRRAVGNGIAIAGARNAYVLSSTIKDVGLDALFFAETKRVFIRRNRVINAGLYAGPRPSLAAINAHRTESATIDENIVENSAYIGIRFSGDARIRQNYVSQSCLFLSDCAAIYTWRRNARDRRPHSEIIGNLIDGVDGDTTVKLGVTDFFAGIYLDEFSNGILVANNIMVGVNQGIYLHNAYDNEVRNNVVRARKTSLIDAADKTRFPALAGQLNTVHSNSERLGNFVAVLIDSTGKKKAFSFDDELRVELTTTTVQSAAERAGQTCTEDEAWRQSPPDKARGTFVSVVNCN